MSREEGETGEPLAGVICPDGRPQEGDNRHSRRARRVIVIVAAQRAVNVSKWKRLGGQLRFHLMVYLARPEAV